MVQESRGRWNSYGKAGAFLTLALLLRPNAARAQLTDDRTIFGAMGGLSRFPVAYKNNATVATGYLRFQHPLISFEVSLPWFKYRTTVSVEPPPPIRVYSSALIPEADLQVNRTIRRFELFAGGGLGWGIPLQTSTLSGGSIHGLAGLRFRITTGFNGRLEVRVRRIAHQSMFDFLLGAEGWPRKSAHP